MQQCNNKKFNLNKFCASIVLLAFTLTNTNMTGGFVFAQESFYLPAPGQRVALSPTFNPPILKGIKVHPDNPFRFDFVLDQGEKLGTATDFDLKQESTKLIKYFLASLTVPEKDLWVNLSPYEKDRIIPNSFGQTEMGRDLLAQDYTLKQITASLIYPEDDFGKKFWKRIYQEVQKKYGVTNIPVNTFNKVWIVPAKAVVYENSKVGTAYVVESKLKVMLEEDYLAIEKNSDGQYFSNQISATRNQKIAPITSSTNAVSQQTKQIVQEIVIPSLTKEVNEGKNFAQLRQVYNSLILATWYKKKIKDSILAKVYADRNKVAGIKYEQSVITTQNEVKGKDHKENDIEGIYYQYLQAFKKGVYNYIKEEQDPITQQPVARKYFSGGVDCTALGDMAMITIDKPVLGTKLDSAQIVSAEFKSIDVKNDYAMTAEAKKYSYWLTFRITKLIQELKNGSNFDRRTRAAEGLKALAEGQLITAEDIPRVITAMLKGVYIFDMDINKSSMEGLKALAEGQLITAEDIPRVITGMLQGLNSNDMNVRVSSAAGFRALAEGQLIAAADIPRVIAGMLRGLNDGNVYVRQSSAEGLRALADRQLITVADIPSNFITGTLQGLNDDFNEVVRQRLTEGLKTLAERQLIAAADIPRVITGMLQGLDDVYVNVRKSSAEGLRVLAEGQLIAAADIPRVIAGMLRGLNSKDMNVRESSAAGLRALAERQLITAADIAKVIAGMLQGLNDGDPDVRQSSVEELTSSVEGKLITAADISRVITGMLQGLNDGNVYVRQSSAAGFRALAEGQLITAADITKVIAGMLQGLNDGNVYVRLSLAEGFRALAEGKLITEADITKVIAGMLQGLNDSNPDVCKSSAEGLRVLADRQLITAQDIPPDTITRMFQELSDRNGYVSLRSAERLKILVEGKLITAENIPRVITGMLQGLNSNDMNVRAGSAEGLKALAEGQLITTQDIPRVITGMLQGLKDIYSFVIRESAEGLKALAEGRLITAADISRVITGMLRGLNSNDMNVRVSSAEGLKALAKGQLITAADIPSSFITEMLQGLNDGEVQVRKISMEGLKALVEGKLIAAADIPRVITGMLEGLNDDEAIVRIRAAEGLKSLSLMVDKPFINSNNVNLLRLIFNTQTELMIIHLKNGFKHSREFTNAIECFMGFLNQHGSLGDQLDSQLADALVEVGSLTGSYLHPLIALAKEKGIITEQMRNRISGAELRWAINAHSNLLNGRVGQVMYGALGYTAQGASLGVDSRVPQPLVNIRWKADQNSFIDQPPQVERYWPATMVDGKGQRFDFIAYLGEVMPGMSDFEAGIIGNGNGPLPNKEAESNRKAESWQYFKFNEADVPRRRPVRTIWNNGQSYHVVFLGFKADLSYALYQVLESGAVFRACINVYDFKHRIAEAKNIADRLPELNLAKAEEEVFGLIKDLDGVLEELSKAPINTEVYDEDFVKGLRQMLRYLMVEGFIGKLQIPALNGIKAEDVLNMDEDQLISIAERVLIAIDKEPDLKAILEELSVQHMPSLLSFKLLGYRLVSSRGNVGQILNRVSKMLNERWGSTIGQVSTEASAEQIRQQLDKVSLEVRNLLSAGAMLKSMQPFFSYNEFEWLKNAGEHLTIGQVSDLNGVSHYPVFQAMHQIARPIEYHEEKPNTHFAYVYVEGDLSAQLPDLLKNRRVLLGQGRTVKELLNDVGFSNTDQLTVKLNGNEVDLNSGIQEQETFKVFDKAMTTSDKVRSVTGLRKGGINLTADSVSLDVAMITVSEYENLINPILKRHNSEKSLDWSDILRRLEGEYVPDPKGTGLQRTRHVIPDAELSEVDKNIREAKEKFIEGNISAATQLLESVITVDKDGILGKRANDLKDRIAGMGDSKLTAIDRQILVLEPTASDVLRAIRTLSLTDGMYDAEEIKLQIAIGNVWATQHFSEEQKIAEFRTLANVLMSVVAAYPDINDLSIPIEDLFLRLEDPIDSFKETTPKEIRDLALRMNQLISDLQHYDSPRTEANMLAEELLMRALKSILDKKTRDSAQLAEKKNVGGIDLTPTKMNLETQDSGSKIKFNFDPALLQQLESVPGFVPVIINIRPMVNLKEFLEVANPL